ncbi:MAG: phosphate ABC transporter substrate-binding protein PstS [Anaerolineae bacterium]|nr:MAG: phosphate ABC transporter substrate-binding protein PstS [Anaerolineae bacterium]
MRKKVWFLLALMLVFSMLLAACGGQSATPTENNAPITLNGAGATFPLPVYTEWIQMYKSVEPAVTLNYQGIGSGGGQKAILDGTVDFAGSDSLLKEEQYALMPDLQMLPILAGAVVPIYNIPEADNLVLDGPTMAGIFMGTITTWNDPAITALNPDIQLPGNPIFVAHRSDGSGTTEIFTSYLGAVSQEWVDTVGVGKAVEWPADAAGQGIGGKGNPGVAQAVQSTPYSIGYVELSYAKSNNIPFADMLNQAGNRVTANAETMQDAMAAFANAFDERLTTKIVNAPGEKSWPIMGYTYLVIHMKENPDCAKTKALLDYIQWSISDSAAAQKAADLGYATLPDAVRELVVAKLQQVTCGNGEKVLP